MHIHNHNHSPSFSHDGPDSEKGKLMRSASLFSLIIGIVLVFLKALAWYFTDSLSMMSSLADSLLDVIASSINFIAIRYSLQPPDEEHRFGHGKAEDLATMAQSSFIAISGIFLIAEGIKRIIEPVAIHNDIIGIIVMLISVVLTFVLLKYQRHVVKETNSGAIAADALHYLADLLTNMSVVFALIAVKIFHFYSADAVIGILIAIYLMYGSFSMAKRAFHNLMDHEFSDQERDEIRRIANTHPEVLDIHDLRTRKSGIYRFIQFHLRLDGSMSLNHAHKISDMVESELRQAFPQTEILIHQDPKNEPEH